MEDLERAIPRPTMKIVSSAALPHASMIWINPAQGWVLTVLCKATFTLSPGLSPLAESQEDIAHADEHWNDDPNRSLRRPSDMAPFKPRAEVLLVGSACAPREVPVRSLVARLIVGDVDKSVEVTQDRWIQGDGTLATGQTFLRMPLVYERAGGGPDTSNPVGVRPGTPDGLGRARLPNLTWPGTVIRSANDIVEPAGFGPVSPSWPARRDKLGALARSGLPERWQEAPLPEGFDFRYFNTAPPDQQTDSLPPGARIILENMHPGAPRLVTNLASVQPFVLVEGRSAAPQPMRADTLWIDTDRLLCTVTFRAQLSLRRKDEAGEVKLWTETQAQAGETPARPEPTPIPGTPRPRPTPVPNTPQAAFHSTAPPPSQPVRRVRQTTQELVYDPTDPNLWTKPPSQALPFTAAQAQSLAATAPPAAPPPPPAHAAPQSPPTFFGLRAPPPPPSVPPPAPPPAWEPPPPAPWSTPVRETSSAIVIPLSSVEPAVPTPPRAEPPAPPAPVAAPPAPAPVQRRAPTEYVEILWFDDRAPQRIRQETAWAELLRGERKTSEWIVGEEPEERDQAFLDRRDVRRALGRVPSLDAAGIARAMEESVDEDGIFEQPVVVVSGELSMSFDPLETLRTTLSVASQLAGGDKRLKEAVDAASEISSAPRAALGPLIEGALSRVRQAFALANRSLAPDYLETTVQRILTEDRSYVKRRVLGGSHIVGMLALSAGGAPIPTYMPEALADKLPLFPKLRVRAVAEPRAPQDPSDPEPVTLRVLALGRVTPIAATPKRER